MVLSFLGCGSWTLALAIPAGEAARVDGRVAGEGEVAVYEATWNGLPVATAQIRKRAIWEEGKKFYQVLVQARTLPYLDLIWKMRDSLESTFEADNLRPHRFVFRRRENRRRIETRATYHPGEEKWVIRREKKKKIKVFELRRSSFDPVSAAYFVRSQDFLVGDQIRLEVFVDKRSYLITLDVLATEKITVKAGMFDAYKLALHVARLGSSDPGYYATTWLSADPRKVLLKVSAPAFAGHFYVELVKEME